MPAIVTPLNPLKHQQSTRRNMTIHETHKHYFEVTDLGDTDNDNDRSIVPSINTILQNEGIECVVDGDEMNQAGFEVWTYSDRETVKEILQKNGVDTEE